MPKDVIVKNYECEFCGNRFETFDECQEHEFDSHKCPNCEFGYYVYGCEFECELLNNDCECSFNPNKNFILGKLRKLYHERDEYFEMAENDQKVGLQPWGCEIAIIQIENEIKKLERLLSNEKSN
jgi:hypothetical protein